MNKVIDSEKLPIKLWTDFIEESALAQAKNLANLPFAFRHIAIMPDVHAGYGMPIGGVLATKGVIIPNAVGVDIGCGMYAVRTSLHEIETDKIKELMSSIRTSVPVGFNHHSHNQDENYMPMLDYSNLPIVRNEYRSARKQVGTLGGGNHFIEIQKGSDGYVWVMVHSGSRNIGKKVADHYNKLAIQLNEKWFSSIEKSKELAFLPFDTEEAQLYFREMEYCIEFAFNNRSLIIERIVKRLREIFPDITFGSFVNIPHNYAKWENHFGQNVIVHRKGATSAQTGQLGIIPGSQGTSSYIVKGLGNPESFTSCSHGAGRALGRTQARKTLSLEGEIEKLNEQGIIHSIRNESDLDEASGAYKDIKTVMENQKDLVEILVELKPLAVIKG